MIITNICGGLGNQMFQYAFGYALSRHHNQSMKLDTSTYKGQNLRHYQLNQLNTNLGIASANEISSLKYTPENTLQMVIRKLGRKQRILSQHFYNEPHFQYDNNAFKAKDYTYFNGYWQSEKYFVAYRSELLEQFTLRNPLYPKSKEYQKLILSSNSVSLHVRRGDYITNTLTNSVHGICSIDYYKKAIRVIEKNIATPAYFIFSDDLSWTKDNLDFLSNVTYIELEDSALDFEEMYLMSLCQHHIIANSSFSWWGAWLNSNPNKIVIAPQKWFNDTSINTDDLIPESWLRL